MRGRPLRTGRAVATSASRTGEVLLDRHVTSRDGKVAVTRTERRLVAVVGRRDVLRAGRAWQRLAVAQPLVVLGLGGLGAGRDAEAIADPNGVS
jgi:hypothetical protein